MTVVQYEVVSKADADVIRRGPDSAWLTALLSGDVIKVEKRPSMTKGQQERLDAAGKRLRSRQNANGLYLWLDDRPTKNDDYPLTDSEMSSDEEASDLPL